MDTTGKILKMVSMLLEYPDRHFFEGLAEAAAVAAHMPEGASRRGAERFLTVARAAEPLALQEFYTAAFDMNPSSSLNMAYQRWGDSEQRARALSGLQQIYREGGYEVAAAELPDYLPLILEFLAVCPGARSRRLVRECLAPLGELAKRLDDAAPHYAGLLRLAAGRLEGPVAGDGPDAGGKQRQDRPGRERGA